MSTDQEPASATEALTSVTLGESSILTTDDSGNANQMVAQQASLGQTATIQSLSFYVTSAAGKLRLGLYDATGPSSGPGVKRAETAEITPVVGWNTANVLTPISLAAGSYWLAYSPSSNSLHFRIIFSGSQISHYYVSSYGVMPSSFSSTNTSIAAHWSLYATLSGSGAPDNPPSVATGASASLSSVSATTSRLSVLGADDGGEANLTYTWAATGTVAAPVTFSVNGSNAAKSTGAMFAKAGTYNLQATIKDQANQIATSSVSVTVSQTLTSIAVIPASASVSPGGTQQFTATANDQFNLPMSTPPSLTWAVSGGGTLSSNGLFMAGSTAGGPFTLTASSGGKSGSGSVSVGAAVANVQSALFRVNCGGGAVIPFAADQFFSFGSTYLGTDAIATNGIANAAPASVYQSERFGNQIYTFNGLAPGSPYTVRLHFAEIYWTVAGSRQFNVSINGAQVLTNFDIFAVAGKDVAVVRDFMTNANTSGQVVIQYTTIKDNAKSSGIEILTPNGAAGPTVLLSASPTSVASGSSSTLTWSSTSASSCTGSGAWSGAKPTSGTGSTGPLAATSTFSLICSGPGGSTGNSTTVTLLPPPSAAFPLKASSNGRYLIDQNNLPFLIVGDSPQYLIANLSLSEAETYLANRQAHGFNTIWVNLLCVEYTGCRADGSTYDGILPFTVPGDLSKPNEAYFKRADDLVKLAAQHGIQMLLDPIETGGWLSVLTSNGATKARAYGQYVGNRYRNFDNLIWQSGNDFQTWSTASDDAVVTAVAQGIKDVDTRHLQTIELDYNDSGSLDDPNWAPLIGLNASYAYDPSYIQVLKDYNRSAYLPTFLVEGDYEGQTYAPTPTPVMLRRQEYWTNLSGATGQLYGNRTGNDVLDTKMVAQFGYVTALFAPRPWYNLVPDQNHSVVTAGYGTFGSGSTYYEDSDYVTTARVADGSLVIAYMPTLRGLTVDMTKLRGSTTARWYDPATGSFVSIAGSPFANSGTRVFTPPASNSDGDGDWALVLESP